MFTPPAIASELARQRHRDLLAYAYRPWLGRQVYRPSTLSRRLRFRAWRVRWHLVWSVRRSVLLPGHSGLDDAISRHA